MIKARFCRQNGQVVQFRCSGHAGYADRGQDIICAAVTSAVQMTANALTECAHLPAVVTATEGEIAIEYTGGGKTAQILFDSLHLQLTLLMQDHPKHIQVTDTEV